MRRKRNRPFLDGGESARKFSDVVAERGGGPLPLELIVQVQQMDCEGAGAAAIAEALGLCLDDVRRVLES